MKISKNLPWKNHSLHMNVLELMFNIMILIYVLLFRFDWYDGEPNDWHSQDCLTFLKDQVRQIYKYFIFFCILLTDS